MKVVERLRGQRSQLKTDKVSLLIVCMPYCRQHTFGSTNLNGLQFAQFVRKNIIFSFSRKSNIEKLIK